jgi:nitroreductase
MGFRDVVRRRRMVRQFTDDPVPQHSLDRILANAVRGPPAGFCQGQACIAALLILLTAVDEGLAGVCFGIVDHETQALRPQSGIPDDHQPIGAFAIGHDGQTERASLASRRRPLAAVIR